MTKTEKAVNIAHSGVHMSSTQKCMDAEDFISSNNSYTKYNSAPLSAYSDSGVFSCSSFSHISIESELQEVKINGQR